MTKDGDHLTKFKNSTTRFDALLMLLQACMPCTK